MAIKRLKPPSQGAVTYWDDASPLGLRVSQGGARTFIVLLGSGQRRKIGRYPVLKLSEAREQAKRVLAKRTLGQEQHRTITFSDALELFLETHCRLNNKPSTAKETERLLRKHFKRLRRRQLAEIKAHDISAIIDGLLPTPGTANGAFKAIRAFFRWAVRRHYIEHSPCEGMQLPSKPRTKDRVLDDVELAAVWRAAEQHGYPYGAIVQLLILTGQRRGEIAALQWDWIDDDTITLPAHITKNGRQHTFPIENMTKQLIKDLPKFHEVLLFPARGKDTPFCGWSKSKNALDRLIVSELSGDTLDPEDLDSASLDITPWTLHDLRRTFATNLAALGSPIHVTEKMLNHVSGSVSGVAAVYNRHSYMDEMQTSIDAWEQKLSQLLEEHPVET